MNRYHWFNLIMVIGIVLIVALIVWVLSNPQVSGLTQAHIDLYQAYYAECLELSEDAEMCVHLAAAKAVK